MKEILLLKRLSKMSAVLQTLIWQRHWELDARAVLYRKRTQILTI